MRRQTALGVEAARLAGVWVEVETQDPDQGRMVDQEPAQLGHALFAFFDFDQIGRHKWGAPFGLPCIPVA